MAEIMAGTTGVADVRYETGNQDCFACHAAGTCGFDSDSLPAPGWVASYDDNTISVPTAATPGEYVITVRRATSLMHNCPNGSAPCKHLGFTVVAATLVPPEGCGSCVPTPSGTNERQCSCDAGKCPPCAQVSGNLTESGGGNPQRYDNYLGGSLQPSFLAQPSFGATVKF